MKFLSDSDSKAVETSNKFFCATETFSEEAASRPWSEIKNVVDKMNTYMCGHSS